MSNIPGAKYKIDGKNELKSSVSNAIYVIKYLLSSNPFLFIKRFNKGRFLQWNRKY